jgi:LmbE family N-acetylglucosaminyl deacetylase
MLFSGKRILLVGPHPDDIEYGCGGTVAKYSRGNEVSSVIFAPCLEDPLNAGILEEYEKAMRLLGVRKIMKQELPRDKLELHSQEIRNILHDLKIKLDPQVVMCPSVGDLHQDHRIVGDCCLTVFRDTATILAYEITRSTRDFSPTLFVELSNEDMQKKLRALRFYETQHRRSYFKPSAFKALAIVRGCQVNTKYAEAFEIKRMIDSNPR